MKQRISLLFFFLLAALPAAAGGKAGPSGRGMKIVSLLSLIAALVLAIRKLKGSSRK